MAELTEALRQEDSAEARELVRSLVDYITLIPDGDQQRIEVRGELAAILRMAQGPGHARSTDDSADALAVQVKMVAGARNHLCRTRFRIGSFVASTASGACV
jgi:hypothetical protein